MRSRAFFRRRSLRNSAAIKPPLSPLSSQRSASQRQGCIGGCRLSTVDGTMRVSACFLALVMALAAVSTAQLPAEDVDAGALGSSERIVSLSTRQAGPGGGLIRFEDAGGRPEATEAGAKRRRRRRKPKLYQNAPQRYPGGSWPHELEPSQAPSYGSLPQHYGAAAAAFPFSAPSYSGDGGVIAALESVAARDDAGCVARLVCELTANAAPAVLTNLPALQPLLTLVAAYGGGASPLLVYGRAALLGLAGGSNRAAGGTTGPGEGSCRLAHPLCPADAEQLVHYLNTHRGGFAQLFAATPPLLPPPVGLYSIGAGSPHQGYGSAFGYGLAPAPAPARIQRRIQNKPFRPHPAPFPGFHVNAFSFTDSKYESPSEKMISFPLEDGSPGRWMGPGGPEEEFRFPATSGELPRGQYESSLVATAEVSQKWGEKGEGQVVYVVRGVGGGDPLHPEVVRLRPGHSLR